MQVFVAVASVPPATPSPKPPVAENVPDLAWAPTARLRFLGGVPEIVVPDNRRSR